MSYEKVIQAKKIIIGTKQTVKALKTDIVKEVIIAMMQIRKLQRRVVETRQRNRMFLSHMLIR